MSLFLVGGYAWPLLFPGQYAENKTATGVIASLEPDAGIYMSTIDAGTCNQCRSARQDQDIEGVTDQELDCTL